MQYRNWPLFSTEDKKEFQLISTNKTLTFYIWLYIEFIVSQTMLSNFQITLNFFVLFSRQLIGQ